MLASTLSKHMSSFFLTTMFVTLSACGGGGGGGSGSSYLPTATQPGYELQTQQPEYPGYVQSPQLDYPSNELQGQQQAGLGSGNSNSGSSGNTGNSGSSNPPPSGLNNTPNDSIAVNPEPVVNVSNAITSVEIASTVSSNQSNVPFTFGQVFKQGDVRSNESLVGKLTDGSTLTLQVDKKATHADGSLRHAIISGFLPALSSGQAITIGLAKTSNTSNTSASTPTDLINAGFSASARITLGGQNYTAVVEDLLKTSAVTTWLSGPMVTEWHVWSPLKTASGTEHPHLTARFAIRAYAGMSKVRVDTTIENAWTYEPNPSNFTYDAAIRVGGQDVYSKAGLTHYHHARWRKVFWWGAAPQTHVKHHTGYLIATKAVANYDQSIGVSESAIQRIRNIFQGAVAEPMKVGLAQSYMPTTGGRDDIGLLPAWAVSYLLSMDKDAKYATFGMGDLAGSWSIHYRDRNTNKAVSVRDYPHMTILGHKGDTYNPVTKMHEAFPECGGVCTNSNVADSAHQPSLAYLPYLVSGDHYYLEELQFWAMYNIFQHNPYYREHQTGLLQSDQVRGQAWALRTLGNAAFITPDNDGLKEQFNIFLHNNLDWYTTTYINNPSSNSLGIIVNGAIDNSTQEIKPWMDDFFTSAVGYIADLGYEKAKPLLLWKSKYSVSRMTDPGYCWIQGSSYVMKVRDNTSAPIYTTIAQVYQATFPNSFTSLACDSAAMASSLGLNIGEMVGYSGYEAGYPSNLQPALAYSANSGNANGQAAWQRFMARSVKPDYSVGAQFAILPR